MREAFSIIEIRKAVDELLGDCYPAVDIVAREMGVSPRTLQRRLVDKGLTYSMIVQQVRLVRTCELLAKGDKPIWKIAQNTGFSSPSSFSRAFNHWTGLSPSEFRNRIRLS